VSAWRSEDLSTSEGKAAIVRRKEAGVGERKERVRGLRRLETEEGEEEGRSRWLDKSEKQRVSK